MNPHLLLFVPGAIAILGHAGDARAADLQAAAVASSLPRVEEITVTARKRIELLEEAPVSVSVVDRDVLRATEATWLQDIQDLVPNLRITEQFTGTAGAGVSIRGVVTEDPAIALDPGVGVYIDGIYLPRTAGQLVDLLDVERVEVLRGPQGTLFGQSSIGGVINIITSKPNDDLGGYARLRPGNFGSIDTQVMLNLPIDRAGLGDRLWTRFAFGSSNRDGYVANPFRGEDMGDRNSLKFLGSIRFLPVDELIIDISGTWARSSVHPRAGQCSIVNQTPIDALAPGFEEACARTRPFRTSLDTAALGVLQSYGTWGVATWDVGDVGWFEDLVLRSLTSWREQRPQLRLDLDSTELPVVASAVSLEPSTGRSAIQRQISQELQASASAWEDRLRLTAGFFAFWEKAVQDGAVEAVPAVIGTTQIAIDTDNSSWALFGQATVDPLEWLSLTAGVRFTSDRKEVDYQSTPPGAPQAAVDFSDGASFSPWTPMASIALRAPEHWHDAIPADSLLAYFSYSRGFRSGGFDAVASPVARTPRRFSPETLDSFEGGVKFVGFQRRASLNIALFHGNYDDIQVYQLTSTPSGLPDVAILNAAEATIRGVEVELRTIPVGGLEITGSLGLLDSEYDRFEGISDLDGSPINRDGQRLQLVPEIDSHLGIQYSIPLRSEGPAWLDGQITPRLDWAYRGNTLYLGPEVPEARQSGYHLFDARISYAMAEGNLELALWGKNLSDEEYFDFVFPLTTLSGSISRLYQTPRTFGGEVTVRF